MAKEVKIKCCMCKAKHRESFMIPLENVWSGRVCEACASEYRQIFNGYQNRKMKKPRKNSLFEAFERGWLTEEAERGFEHLPIPEAVKRYYDQLLFEKGPNAKHPSSEEILQLCREPELENIDERIPEDS